MLNRTLKSLDFTATCHNYHNFGLFVIICFKNQNFDTFIIIFLISACVIQISQISTQFYKPQSLFKCKVIAWLGITYLLFLSVIFLQLYFSLCITEMYQFVELSTVLHIYKRCSYILTNRALTGILNKQFQECRNVKITVERIN